MSDSSFAEDRARALDIVWEARGIAPLIGRTERQVAHMLVSGALPGAKKIGGRWCIRRSALIAAFEDAPAIPVK